MKPTKIMSRKKAFLLLSSEVIIIWISLVLFFIFALSAPCFFFFILGQLDAPSLGKRVKLVTPGLGGSKELVESLLTHSVVPHFRLPASFPPYYFQK